MPCRRIAQQFGPGGPLWWAVREKLGHSCVFCTWPWPHTSGGGSKFAWGLPYQACWEHLHFCAFSHLGTLHISWGWPLCIFGQLPHHCTLSGLGNFLISAYLGFMLLLTWQVVAYLAPPIHHHPTLAVTHVFLPQHIPCLPLPLPDA